MSGNAWHVPNSDADRLPLPAPSTSRNLLPRFATSQLSRRNTSSTNRTSSNSRSLSVASSHSPSHPSRNSSSSTSGSNSQTSVMQSFIAQSSGSSKAAKRRRTRYAHAPDDGLTSDEEEVDQLLSDNDVQEPPPSQSVGEPSSQKSESQSTSDSQSFIAVPTDIRVLPQATSSTSVSSPSLAKILHPINIDQISPSSTLNSSSTFTSSAGSFRRSRSAKPKPKPEPEPEKKPEPEHEPLSGYTCPICFFPPTNATITPCGHICCGSCLFTAVKTTMQRGAAAGDGNVARCPVCRAEITKWDGKGGGVIGLKTRALFSL